MPPCNREACPRPPVISMQLDSGCPLSPCQFPEARSPSHLSFAEKPGAWRGARLCEGSAPAASERSSARESSRPLGQWSVRPSVCPQPRPHLALPLSCLSPQGEAELGGGGQDGVRHPHGGWSRLEAGGPLLGRLSHDPLRVLGGFCPHNRAETGQEATSATPGVEAPMGSLRTHTGSLGLGDQGSDLCAGKLWPPGDTWPGSARP